MQMDPVKKILGKRKLRKFVPEDEDIVEFGSTYEEAYGNEVDVYGN